MTISVQLPDGRSVDVETDDPNVAAAAGKKFLDKEAAEGQRRMGQIALQGQARSAADLVGFPLDYVSTAVTAATAGANELSQGLGGPELPVYQPAMAPSDAIANLASKAVEPFGVETYDKEDMSGAERFAYEGARFGTGAALPGGLLSRTTRAAEELPVLGNTIRALAEPYRNAGFGTVATDVAGGVGAGAGLSGYEESVRPYLKDYLSEGAFNALDPIAQTIVMLLGGIGGSGASVATQATTKAGVRAGEKVLGLDQETGLPRNEATGRPFSRGEVDQAADIVQNAATNPQLAARNLEDNVAEFLPNYQPDQMAPTGLMSDDPGLTMVENRMRQAEPLPFIERDQNVNSAVRDQLDTIAPDGQPRDFTNKANYDYGRRVARAEGRVTAAQNALTAEERAGVRQAGRTGLGARSADTERAADMDIYNTLNEGTLLPAQERNKARYDAVDEAEAGDLDASGLLRLADRIESTGALSALPGKTRNLLQRVRGLEDEDGNIGPVTAQDIKEVLPELSQIERTARTSLQPNLALADDVGRLRDGLTRMINRGAKEGDEASAALQTAREEYRKPGELGGIFGQGQARTFREEANAARFDPKKQRPSQVAGDFVKPNQPELATELTNIMNKSDRPLKERRRQVREKMLSNLAAAGAIDEKTGQLRPDVIRKWRDKWGGTIDAIDNGSKLRRDVDAWLDRAQRGDYQRGQLEADVRAAESRLSQVEKEKGALGAVLDKDPDHAVASVFNSSDPEREMKAIVSATKNNDRAHRGLKAAVREYLVEKATVTAAEKTRAGDTRRPVSWSQLDKMFSQHERTLSAVYNRQEMQALRQMHRMLEKYTGRNLQATTKSPTAERLTDKEFMGTLELFLKAPAPIGFGVLKGGSVYRTVRRVIEQLPNNEEAVAQLMRQFAFDPDLARHLLTRDVGAKSAQWNAKLNRILAYGQGRRAFIEDMADDEEDDDAVSD
jgi:hypothetical protein